MSGEYATHNLLPTGSTSGYRLVDGHKWPGYAEPGNWTQRAKCTPGKAYTLSCIPEKGGEVCFGFYLSDGSCTRPNGYEFYNSGAKVVRTLTAPDNAVYVAASWADGNTRPMVVEGSTPVAWAPAEGEELAGGGASMSANLLAGYAPGLVSGTTKYTGPQVTPETDLWSSAAYTAEDHTDTIVHYASNGNFPTLAKLTSNQTVTMSFGVKAASSTSFSAGKLHAWVKYKDAAGNANWVNSSAQSETISQSGWTRIAGTVVVPSGMTIVGCGVSKHQGAGAFIQTDVTLSYGSGVPLAEETFTPFEPSEHAQTTYATYASQKILSDSITSEVNARAKTDGAVSDLSSKMEQTVNGINVSLDKLTATERQIHSWFDFGSDASGNPKLSMGSSSSPIIGEYSNTGTTYKDRSGATLLALDAANSTTGADHMVAKDMTIGNWQWVPTNNGTHLTLMWIGG